MHSEKSFFFYIGHEDNSKKRFPWNRITNEREVNAAIAANGYVRIVLQKGWQNYIGTEALKRVLFCIRLNEVPGEIEISGDAEPPKELSPQGFGKKIAETQIFYTNNRFIEKVIVER